MNDTPTTLATFAEDAPSIRRTANEYATSYDVSVPEEVLDIESFSGYIRYSLVTEDNTPCLRLTLNPEVDAYHPNILLVTGETRLPIPRGILEVCSPDALTDWRREADTVTASFEVPNSETVLGERLTQGTQQIREYDDDEFVLTLPKHPAIQAQPACSLQLMSGSDGLELAVTLVSESAEARPIHDSTTLPQTPIPAALVRALDVSSVAVTVFDGGPLTTRSTLLSKYPAALGQTSGADVSLDESRADLPLPKPAQSALADAEIDSGVIRAVADDGGLLAVFDGNQSDGERGFTVTKNGVSCQREFARWLGLTTGTLHWHYHDGTLIAEAVGDRPAAIGNERVIGQVTDEGFEVPRYAFEMAEIDLTETNELEQSVTVETDTLGVAFTAGAGGVSTRFEINEDHVTFEMPTIARDSLGDETHILCTAVTGGVVCIPMDETTARRRAGVATTDEVSDARLHLPESGRDSQIHLRGTDSVNPTVRVPDELTEQFNLQEGSKFDLTVGTYNGALALHCTPIDDDNVGPDVCLGRMLNQSDLRLPIQLVATLALLERPISWGVLWESDGPRMLGLIERFSVPPLSEGLDVGDGQVYTTTKTTEDGSSGGTHYSVTIPKAAFNVYDDHPPAVAIECDAIEGDTRLVLMPVGEEFLSEKGVVKLRENWDNDYYQVTLPKGLASALRIADGTATSWTFLDGQFVGTMALSQRF